MKKASLYNKKWREKYPEKIKEMNRRDHERRKADPIRRQKVLEYHRKQHKDVSNFCKELKSRTPCMDCGKHDEYYLMDFDHRDGQHPKYRSPQACRSLPELHRELARCDIVCVRCHRIRTYTRRIKRVAKT